MATCNPVGIRAGQLGTNLESNRCTKLLCVGNIFSNVVFWNNINELLLTAGS